MTIEQIANTLGKASRKANGGYMAACPAHDDSTASLSIDEKDGKILFKCFAGCTQDAVMSAIKDRGYLPEPDRQPDAPRVKSIMVGRYQYKNAEGEVSYWKERFEPGKGGSGKDFRFKHVDPTTGEIRSGRGEHNHPILYNLPDVLRVKTIVIVEGEKHADFLMSWGIVASTTDAGASGKLSAEMVEQLTGKRIAILRDNDKPGLDYANNIAQSLNGKASSLRIVLLPDLPNKGDVIDWVEIPGNNKDKLIEIIKAAPEWSPSIGGDCSFVNDPAEVPELQPAKPLFISGATFGKNRLKRDYLIKSLVMANTDVMIVGPSGEGKSFIVLQASIAVVHGSSALGGLQCKKGAVLYMAGEGREGIELRALGMLKDLGLPSESIANFHLSSSTIEFDGSGLREAIAEARKIENDHGVSIRLIVIDTLHRHMIGEENSAKDTGEYIRSIQRLRESFPGSVTFTVHHVGHGENSSGRGRGSSAVPAAMDTILLCNKGLLTCTKQKDGPVPEPIEFKLKPIHMGVDDDGNDITTCVVEYGARAQKHLTPSLTGQEKIIVRLLDDSDNKSELIGDLRKRFYTYRQNLDPEVKANTMKNAYLKVIPSLIEKQVIRQDGNLISLITPETSPVILSSFPVISDGLSIPSSVISPYKGDD